MNRTCKRCGWVHFAVTREFAEKTVAKFNEFYDRQPEAVQQSFSRRASIVSYECCNVCGNPHTNFRDAADGDCPRGVTMGPIIMEAV